MANIKKYFTEEERIAAKREREKKYRETNKEKIKSNRHKFYLNNKKTEKERAIQWIKEHPEYKKKYRSTKKGKANHLCDSYRQNDIKHNRGECVLTSQWIVDNIFTSKCFYCDKDDWHKLGCDRIYNDLPHTPENVVCCCEECNAKRGRKGFVEYLKEIGRLDKLKELKDKVIITDEVLID